METGFSFGGEGKVTVIQGAITVVIITVKLGIACGELLSPGGLVPHLHPPLLLAVMWNHQCVSLKAVHWDNPQDWLFH